MGRIMGGHYYQTNQGLTISQRSKKARDYRAGWLVDNMTVDDAWKYLRSKKWGAIRVYGKRLSGFNSGFEWWVYRIEDWARIWKATNPGLGIVKLVKQLQRAEQNGQLRIDNWDIPLYVKKALIEKGKLPPEE